jgi:hypothetical protein
MFDVVQIDVGGLPLWVFALGHNASLFHYDVRVLDIDDQGQVKGLCRLLDLPVSTDRELSAWDASQLLSSLQDVIRGYRQMVPQELRRYRGTVGALAGEPGSTPADASAEPLEAGFGPSG